MILTHTFFDRIKALNEAIDSVDIREIDKLFNLLKDSLLDGDTIYIAGNGGAACSASHICEDLLTDVVDKNFGLAISNIICLSDNSGSITGLGNDCGFEHIFSKQLERMALANDIVILLSGSGKSSNIIRAAEVTKALDCKLVGFTGFDGGLLRELADIKIHVNSYDMGIVQDVHLIIYHHIHTQLQNFFKGAVNV
jgi:D-sedoheptulose 7-phosphate isomerase